MRRIAWLPIGLLLSALFSIVPAAQAADHEFCRRYTDSAIHQFHEAERHGRCRHHIRDNPNRWSGNFDNHYKWCRGVDRRNADQERDERSRILDECR